MEKAMASHSSTLAGKSHGRRSLVGCSPWSRKEWDMTERLHFHFSLSCIGEGNGNLLQCSCPENPRDGGAWWAAVMGSHRVRHDWSDLVAADLNYLRLIRSQQQKILQFMFSFFWPCGAYQFMRLVKVFRCYPCEVLLSTHLLPLLFCHHHLVVKRVHCPPAVLSLQDSTTSKKKGTPV